MLAHTSHKTPLPLEAKFCREVVAKPRSPADVLSKLLHVPMRVCIYIYTRVYTYVYTRIYTCAYMRIRELYTTDRKYVMHMLILLLLCLEQPPAQALAALVFSMQLH